MVDPAEKHPSLGEDDDSVNTDKHCEKRPAEITSQQCLYAKRESGKKIHDLGHVFFFTATKNKFRMRYHWLKTLTRKNSKSKNKKGSTVILKCTDWLLNFYGFFLIGSKKVISILFLNLFLILSFTSLWWKHPNRLRNVYIFHTNLIGLKSVISIRIFTICFKLYHSKAVKEKNHGKK